MVIGIIALLVGILLPTLNRARSSANSVKCQSNLRQIGVGINFYANDNNGAIVPSDINYSDPFMQPNDVPAGSDRPHWAAILVSERVLPGAHEGTALSAANVVTDVESVFRCPEGLEFDWQVLGGAFPTSHEDQVGAQFWLRTSTEGEQVPTWYGVNGTEGRPDVDWRQTYPFGRFPFRKPGATAAEQKVFEVVKLAQVRGPTEMAFVFDGIFRHEFRGFVVNARHDKQTTTNILHGDGHVEKYQSDELPDNSFVLQSPIGLTTNFPAVNWNLRQD